VRAPLETFAPLLRVDPTPRGQAKQSPLLGSEEAGPAPERSGEAEHYPEGSGELGTLSIGLN
jgi:hypothetical protein